MYIYIYIHTCIYIYIYIYIYIARVGRSKRRRPPQRRPSNSNSTVSFHNFKSQNFKLSVSNPKSKYVVYLSVLSQISNCQGLGRKNKHEILKTDRSNRNSDNSSNSDISNSNTITNSNTISDDTSNSISISNSIRNSNSNNSTTPGLHNKIPA